MLTIELISDPDVFEFGPAQHLLVYINETQIVLIRVSKIINRDFFHIHINGEKREISEVKIRYKK
jgi:hypothetical protein